MSWATERAYRKPQTSASVQRSIVGVRGTIIRLLLEIIVVPI